MRARVDRTPCMPAIAGGLVAVGLAVSAAPAQALLLDQFIAPDVPGTGVERNVTVLSRERPEYEPLGVRFGDFTIRPQLTETAGYDDNATATHSAHGSALVETNASVAASYDHSRMNATAELSVDDNEYLNQPQQSYTNWTASLGGNYDLDRDTISAGYSHQNLNQTVQDLDVPQLGQALAFRVDTVRLGYRTEFGRLFLIPSLSVSKFSFDNGIANGVTYQQTYRNRVVYEPTVTVGYTMGRGTIIGVVRGAEANYTDRPAGTPTRNFSDVSALGGIDYQATGFLRYRLLAGYEVRTFTSNAYKTISAPVVEASVIWNPTGLTTVTAEAARRIEDSADETTVGVTESALALRVDHELYRDVLLRASAGYSTDDYSRNGGQQSLYTAGLGATYLLNRNMRVTGNYDFSARRSSGGVSLGTIVPQQFGSSYNDNRFLLQLQLRL